MTARRILIGTREADMLMDGLIALSLNWEDLTDHEDNITSEDQRRWRRLMHKLREART